MAYSITRIELHDADYFDYETLHAAMAERQFQRYYYDADGTCCFLPQAEYIRWETAAKDGLALAKQAVTQTGRAASIIVTVAADFAQDGLRCERPSLT